MDNQPLRLTLFQNGQRLLRADIARHFVFHVIIGKGFKLQARLQRMRADLSIHTYGLAAKTFGNGNTRFALDDGNRIIIRSDRPVGNNFGIDGDGAQMGGFLSMERSAQTGQIVLGDVFQERLIQIIQLKLIDTDNERHREITDRILLFDPKDKPLAGHPLQPERHVRNIATQPQGHLPGRFRPGFHFQKQVRILFTEKLTQDFKLNAIGCCRITGRHHFQPVAQLFIDVTHVAGILPSLYSISLLSSNVRVNFNSGRQNTGVFI